MAMTPTTLPLEWEIRLAWKDTLLETPELQETAAQRLAAYINEGRADGPNGRSRLSAEAVKFPTTGPVRWGLRLRAEIDVQVEPGSVTVRL
jgi:hypothetical protein